MLVRAVNYLHKNHFPYFESRQKVDWTHEEEELLREIFRESDDVPKFYLLALFFLVVLVAKLECISTKC